jgi:hypothetical protein
MAARSAPGRNSQQWAPGKIPVQVDGFHDQNAMHRRVRNPHLYITPKEDVGNELASKRRLEGLQILLICALGAGALPLVAFYNRYPTLFSDSGSYLLTGAFFKALPPFRAPVYSLFTRATSLGITAWFIVAAQAMIAVYVLYETCDYFMCGVSRDRDRLLLASLVILTALTSLPWLVAQLMPDVFAGILFLSVSLMMFAGELHPFRRALLGSVMMISVGAHMSLLPIAILFVTLLAARSIFSRGPEHALLKGSALLWLVVPIVAAAFTTAKLNQSMGLGFRVSPSGKTFLLARLFGDHLATDYLQANCSRRSLISCRYLANLPQSQDEFLFHHPLIRELDGHEDEIAEIERGAILAQPFRFVQSSIWETLRQLVHIRTGDEIRSYGANDWNLRGIQAVFPSDLQAFERSKQSRGLLLPLADAASRAHTRVFWLSLAACIPLAWTGRFERVNQFFFGALVFLVVNAAVCATFAGVYDRYQSRVAWILPMSLAAYAYSWAREWKRGGTFQYFERLLGWQDAPAPPARSGDYALKSSEGEGLDMEFDSF